MSVNSNSTHVVQLFPLLLKSLVFNDAALKLATLEVIQVLMKDSSQIIAEHISSVVPSLLKMTIPKDPQGAEHSIVSDFVFSAPILYSSLNQTIRIKACETIGLLKSTLEYAVLHPYRVQVIKQLLVPCDDHKRLVRKAAANSRNIWMMSNK